MWSPHQYSKIAKSQGLPDETILSAIEWIERIGVTEDSPAIVLTLKHLAINSELDYNFLRSIVNRRRKDTYRVFKMKKRSGGIRYIHVPEYNLSCIQKWINRNILRYAEVNEASYAFAPGSSIYKCAARHCGAKWLIKMDITGFFESISEIQVFHVFHELGYSKLVAFELARIVTIESKSPNRSSDKVWRVKNTNSAIPSYTAQSLGYLPQGAPTSPMISNLVMNKLDEEISKLSKEMKLVYTRYSDDMTFSTAGTDFNRQKANEFIVAISKLISIYGFRPQYKKTTVIPPSARKIVLGLNVDGKTPKLGKKTKDNIRLHLYYLKKFGPAEHKERRKFKSLMGMKLHILGLINYSNMIEPEFARNALNEFNQIEWPSNIVE